MAASDAVTVVGRLGAQVPTSVADVCEPLEVGPGTGWQLFSAAEARETAGLAVLVLCGRLTTSLFEVAGVA